MLAGCRGVTSPAPRQVLLEFLVPDVPVSAQSRNRAKLQQWVSQVSAAATTAWGAKAPLTDSVAVTLTLYALGGWRLDLDNMSKPILDAMTDVVWLDDKQVVDLNAYRRDLDGAFVVRGISSVLAGGFVAGAPFLHVAVFVPSDPTRLP